MVMNNNKQVFGVVEEHPEKEDYIGLETSSAKVTVDNNERTIKVDVNAQDLLGETSNTAYPGHLGADTRRIALSFEKSISDEIDRAKTAEKALDKKYKDVTFNLSVEDANIKDIIKEESDRSQTADTNFRYELDSIKANTTNQLKYVSDEIKDIKQNYADKNYVYEQLVEFSKLSKQLVDDVDLDNNKVIINNSKQDPLDGFIYLKKDDTVTGNDIYQEYTLIEDQLVLIGDTTVDLNDYAKKEDLPDVSEFISSIPDEYITETELSNTLKNYTTFNQVQTVLERIKYINGGNASFIKDTYNI